MRLLVTGSRYWANEKVIGAALKKVAPKVEILIHGAARGADFMADRNAKRLGIPRLPFPVTKEDWETYGKRAGVRRNTIMLEEGLPTWVFAFSDDLSASRGTRDMVGQALEWEAISHIWHYGQPTGWRCLKKPGTPISFVL